MNTNGEGTVRRTAVLAVLTMILVALPGAAQAQDLLRPRPQRGQEGPDPTGLYLAAGVMGGVARGWIPGQEDWTFGPLVGARAYWRWRPAGLGIMADHQLYWADQPTDKGRFKTTYVLPTLVTGSPTYQFKLGVGAIRYDFEDADAVWKFAFGINLTQQIRGPIFLDFGWRRHSTQSAETRSDIFFLGVSAQVRVF